MMKHFLLLIYVTLLNSCATIALEKLDPDHIVPKHLLSKSYDYYVSNLGMIKNRHFMGIIDFNEPDSFERFYLIDMNSGQVEKFLVAHGENSDPMSSGYASIFSNIVDTKKSSLGFYLTAETYEGANGYSLRLDGLSETNSNARERGIVMHGARYVIPGPQPGTSWGCPAIEMRHHKYVIDRLKEGALLYAGHE